MHGLIFVTWEKYLSDSFGSQLLAEYRRSIGETAATAPLASHVYDDATLLAGVGAACELTKLPADTLLKEYGRYFIMNGLTNHLCAYLLTKVHNGRELLLVMRTAHEQMGRTPDALTPPLFNYQNVPGDPDSVVLIYDSPRKLCSVLLGAIVGAGERYKQHVSIVEQTCMNKGAPVCRFEIKFSSLQSDAKTAPETTEQRALRQRHQKLADSVLSILPLQDGMTLVEIQRILQYGKPNSQEYRVSAVLEALHHLHYVGLVASTANQPGDDMTHRRYWRAATTS